MSKNKDLSPAERRYQKSIAKVPMNNKTRGIPTQFYYITEQPCSQLGFNYHKRKK